MEYYKANREQIRAKKKEYYKKNREQIRANRKHRKEHFKYSYDYEEFFVYSKYIIVKRGIKWGVTDKKNNILIPIIYDDVYWFKDGIASVRDSNKYLLVDKKGLIKDLNIQYEKHKNK